MPSPVTTTMTATTVEPASSATVESRSVAVEGSTTVDRPDATTAIPASCITASHCTPIAVSWVTSIAITRASVAVSWATIAVTGATIIPAAAIVAVAPTPAPTMEPGAGSEEYAIHKVIRAVVPIRCASVRIVAVVPISANRSCSDPYAYGTNADSYRNLSVSLARRKNQNCQKCKIF